MFPFSCVSFSAYFSLIYTRVEVSYVSVSFSAYFTSVNNPEMKILQHSQEKKFKTKQTNKQNKNNQMEKKQN